ncbi:MAG TPA: aquaporin [Patescibacteria group bacterium]|jgi:aquaporin Z|nr:aquaporin [Patescibacteria group bacterium]
MTKKLLVEFIGTFFLVLVVSLSGNPVAIGFILMAMVYMGGYISGAHYNPAVTAGLWVSKKIGGHDAVKYIVAQLAGGFAAAGVYTFINKNFFLPAPGAGVSWLVAFIVEMLFTFALVTVVHHTAATEKTKGNDYYGLAIGMTLLAAAAAGGPVSGGAFNPAVGVSPLLFDIGDISAHLGNMLLYGAGPLAGGLLAGWAYVKMKNL